MVERAIVVGGGLGGLSAAIHLAAAGIEVTILEKEAQLGGKMSELRQAGYRWDSGPTVITLRPVLEALFERAGRRLDDYLTLNPVDPLTRYHYPDGTLLDVRASLAQTVANVEVAADLGADAALVVLPYFQTSSTPDGQVRFFEAVIASAASPCRV